MHYERLMRVADIEARQWYMHETARQQWDYRTLKRNIDSQYYYRLVQTPDIKKPDVIDEMRRLAADYEKEKSVFVKNPMIVELLGLKQDTAFINLHLSFSWQVFLYAVRKSYHKICSSQNNILPLQPDNNYYAPET